MRAQRVWFFHHKDTKGTKKYKAKLGQQFKIVAVARAKYIKVTPVESRDSRDVLTFSDSHDTAVD